MFLINNGIKEIEEKKFINQLFCKHEYITCEICSKNGLLRISGTDWITICEKCGKVKRKVSIDN